MSRIGKSTGDTTWMSGSLEWVEVGVGGGANRKRFLSGVPKGSKMDSADGHTTV